MAVCSNLGHGGWQSRLWPRFRRNEVPESGLLAGDAYKRHEYRANELVGAKSDSCARLFELEILLGFNDC